MPETLLTLICFKNLKSYQKGSSILLGRSWKWRPIRYIQGFRRKTSRGLDRL